MDSLNRLTERISGMAIEVHRELGPGLLESIYESALCIEMERAGLKYDRQILLPVIYKGSVLGQYPLDLLIEDLIVLELKNVERYDPVFEAQVLTYLRITSKKLSLLINFNRRLLTQGVKRFILESAL